MSDPVWYRSLYWRIAFGFVALLAILLLAQGLLFLWLTDRFVGPRQPHAGAARRAGRGGRRRRSSQQHPDADLEAFVRRPLLAHLSAVPRGAARRPRASNRPTGCRPNSAERAGRCAANCLAADVRRARLRRRRTGASGTRRRGAPAPGRGGERPGGAASRPGGPRFGRRGGPDSRRVRADRGRRPAGRRRRGAVEPAAGVGRAARARPDADLVRARAARRRRDADGAVRSSARRTSGCARSSRRRARSARGAPTCARPRPAATRSARSRAPSTAWPTISTAARRRSPHPIARAASCWPTCRTS